MASTPILNAYAGQLEVSPRQRRAGMPRAAGAAGPMPEGLLVAGLLAARDPAMRQALQLQAIERVLRALGMPAIRTGGSGPLADRYMLEFLTRIGQVGRVGGMMSDPKQFLIQVENAARQINPVAMMEHATPSGIEGPGGMRGAWLGMGSVRQLIDVLRALSLSAPNILLPLLLNPQQFLPGGLGTRG